MQLGHSAQQQMRREHLSRPPTRRNRPPTFASALHRRPARLQGRRPRCTALAAHAAGRAGIERRGGLERSGAAYKALGGGWDASQMLADRAASYCSVEIWIP